MIFQHTWREIMAGEKTVTRRPIKSTETAVFAPEGNIDAVLVNGRRKWVVGKCYGIQPGRGQKAKGLIKITRIDHQPLVDITEAGALAEGFSDRDRFLDKWREIHGSLDHKVWVIEFVLASPPFVPS